MKKRRAENPDFDGTEEFNFFLSVIFPAYDLKIMDYNRLLYTLGEHTEETFLTAVEAQLGCT